MSDALVSTAWLADHLDAPDVRVADATWFLPNAGRDARADYAAAHIEGALFFDIDEIADETSPYPHMIPSPAKFSARVRAMGLGDGTRIVLYDNNRFTASARAWWMFRLFGHPDVAVLDGGLGAWRSEGRPLTDRPSRPRERHFTVRQNNLIYRELDQIRSNLTAKRDQIVDVRSAGRFRGTEPEPRPGLRGGHIPGARNLPFTALLNPDQTLKSPAALAAEFATAGIDTERAIVTSCGSGVTAAIAALALHELGRPDVAVYDGSWTEWASQPDTPVER